VRRAHVFGAKLHILKGYRFVMDTLINVEHEQVRPTARAIARATFIHTNSRLPSENHFCILTGAADV
jgi:hypothetical protein